MTIAARRVLHDCSYAIARMRPEAAGEELRVDWFTVASLLRTVGHVLTKVDGARSRALCDAISEAYIGLKLTKPQPEIYWGFIETERNAVLKEYDQRVTRVARPHPPKPNSLNVELALHSAVGRPGTTAQITFKGALIQSALRAGPFAGQSEKAIALKAVDWWSAYLDAIDAAVAVPTRH